MAQRVVVHVEVLVVMLTGWAHSWAGRTAVQSCTAGFSSVLSCPLTSQLSWPEQLAPNVLLLKTIMKAALFEKNKNIAEGTRGLFYTIGRLSLPTAETLRRIRRRRRKKTWFLKHSTVFALWCRTAPRVPNVFNPAAAALDLKFSSLAALRLFNFYYFRFLQQPTMWPGENREVTKYTMHSFY